MFYVEGGKRNIRNVPATAATPDAPKGQKKGPGFLTHSEGVLTRLDSFDSFYVAKGLDLITYSNVLITSCPPSHSFLEDVTLC